MRITAGPVGVEIEPVDGVAAFVGWRWATFEVAEALERGPGTLDGNIRLRASGPLVGVDLKF